MSFQSIEEKVIYEKLIDGAVSAPLGSEAEALSVGPVNIRRLRVLMEKVIGYVGILERSRENSSFRPIHPGNRKILAGLVVFIKRAIRRTTRWYIEPVCQQQTVFNNAVSPSIGCITEINDEMINSVLALSQSQTQLQDRQQTDADRLALWQAETETAFVKMQSTIQAQADAAAASMAEMEAHYKSRITAAEAALAAQAEAYRSLEALQCRANQEIVELQSRMDRLNKLDLDIFDENYNDLWEKDAWGVGTFSQCGEDMVVAFLLRAFGIPFEQISYIDLGANHAKKLSNTYHFYKHGARGVLVEANPALIQELTFYRSGDVILNRCVSERSGDRVDFYVMGDSFDSGDGLSTPNKDSVRLFTEINPRLKLHSTVSVETITVNELVENHLGKTPLLLNIDIEGNEVAVLKSIDFTKIRPLVILIEMIPYTLPFAVTERNQEIMDYLTGKGYLEYAFTGVNSVFLDRAQLQEGRVVR